MGILDKLFGESEPEYPELDASSKAAQQLQAVHEPLVRLEQDVPKQRLEVVPSDHGAYVFVGKPPEEFGLAWLEGNEVKNFKTLVEERGIDQLTIDGLIEKLREAYEISSDDPRYQSHIGDRNVIVHPSATLEGNCRKLIEAVNAKAPKTDDTA